MSNTKRASSIKAVGFGFFSPEVVVMFADHDQSCVHVYPSKNGRQLDLSDERDHLILLRSIDKRHTLAEVSSSVHRLILFGKAEELTALNVPLLDATVDDDGKVIPLHKQSRDVMLARIEDEAVDLSLEAPAPKAAAKKAAPEEPEEKQVKMSFVKRLRTIRAEVKEAGGKIDFVADVGMPAVLRVMDDYTREQFKESCKKLVLDGGVSEGTAREFFRWVEGIGYDVNGTTLGGAVDKFLYSDEESDSDAKLLAQRFGLDAMDIEFVAQSYQQLLQEEKQD